MKNKTFKLLSFLLTITLFIGLLPLGRTVNAAQTYKMTLLTDQPGCQVQYIGKNYDSGAVLEVEEGQKINLYAKAAEYYTFVKADSPDVYVNKNGSIGYTLTVPSKDFTVTFHFQKQNPYAMELNSLDLGKAEVGYVPSDITDTLTAKKTGTGIMQGDYTSVKLTSGDVSAFTVTNIGGGNMTVTGGVYNQAYITPVADLPIGVYQAVATLYYDADGSGTAYSPEVISSAYIKFNVISNVKHQMTLLSDNYDSYIIYKQVRYNPGSVISIPEGESVYLYAYAPEEYVLSGAESNDVKVSKNGSIGYQFTMPQKDVTVTFHFKPINGVKVTFDTDGGSPVYDQEIPSGKKVSRPTYDPVKEGYCFWNWYADADCTTVFDFSQPITSDTTIYAYWTKNINGLGLRTVGIKVDENGNYIPRAKSINVNFELETADVKAIVSPLYTDMNTMELLKTNPVEGTAYYFYVDLDDVEGEEGRPTVYYSYDIPSNLTLFSEGATLTYVSLSHSPGGKGMSIWFQYSRTADYSGGWKKIDGNNYYFDELGNVVTGWQKIGNEWYLFDEEGVVKTGWYQQGSIWYYLKPGAGDEHGGTMATGWQKINNTWYYFTDGGVMKTGWVQSGSSWYYMDTNGAMITGWKLVDGKWYFFEGTGVMKTGWVGSGSTYYYMDTNGAMVTGWKQISGKWYYFKASGVMAAGEWCEGYWLNADGSWTYPYKASWRQNSKGWWFGDDNGWYAKNEKLKINDKEYSFDVNGYCTNP